MKSALKRTVTRGLPALAFAFAAVLCIRSSGDADAIANIVPAGAGAPVQMTACFPPNRVRIRNRANRELLGFTVRFRQYDSADTKLSDAVEQPVTTVSLEPGEAGLFNTTGSFTLLSDTRSVKCEIRSARFAGLKIWNAGQKWPEKLHS